MSNIRTSTEAITPAIARSMLNGMGLNRNIRKARVKAIAAAMTQGLFNGLNGETIIVDDDGHLIDGQHRLNAIIESGVSSVKLLVVRGVPPSAKDTVDQGAARTAGDVLGFHGHKYGMVLSAAARWLWIYEHEWPNGIRSRGVNTITTPMIIQIVKQQPEIEVAVEEAVTKYPKASRLMTQSIASFTRLATDRLATADSDEFFMALESGEGSQRTKPVRLLRDKLIARSSRSGRLIPQEIVVITVRVWNAFREGKDLTKLFIGKNLDDPYENTPRFK